MCEEKKARIRIVSRLREPDGGVQEIKHARPGLLRRTDGEIMLEYEDVQEEDRARVTLSMAPGRTAAENRAHMRRCGMVSSALTFLPGEKIASVYVTVYGEIPVAVDTRSVAIRETACGGELALDYDVYMGGERTSRARLEVTWRV